MSAEPGGIASKLGADFEQRFAVDLLIDLLADRVTRIKWEPSSAEESGADIEVEWKDGPLEHAQLKRQNAARASWSVSELDRAGVLGAAAAWLNGGANRRFSFVSADPVPHLKDICDHLLRHSGTAAEFVAESIGRNADRNVVFNALLSKWSLDPDVPASIDAAILRLRGMRFILLDRSAYGEESLSRNCGLALTGDPEISLAALRAFLSVRLGCDIFRQDLVAHLAPMGISPRDLSLDPSVSSAIERLGDEFRMALRGRLVQGELMGRPHVQRILDLVNSESPATRVILVHGKPGMGKSSVLLGVAEELKKRRTPLLPLSLSAQPPAGSVYEYGKTLGLKATPATAIRGTAGSRPAVLLVDQLDALRLTTNAAVSAWRICQTLLKEAITDPQTAVIVACRTFDLENDPNIRSWCQELERDHPGSVAKVDVGVLIATDVERTLQSFGWSFAPLSPQLKALLLHPSSLDVWVQLMGQGVDHARWTTQTQLLSKLLSVLTAEASREHGVAEVEVAEVLAIVRRHMQRDGTWAVPETRFSERPRALQAACSVGLLVQAGRAVSFPHQSYYDHLVAHAALTEAGESEAEILRWLKADQSLLRRDQVRQLLFLLREVSPPRFARVLERMLTDRGVRFHLKQLALGVLREASPVTPGEADLAVSLLEDSKWWSHLRSHVIAASPDWFDALHARGMWKVWLAKATGDRRRDVLRLLGMVMGQRPTEVDSIIAPLLSGPVAADDIGLVFPFNPAEDSPLAAAFREEQYRRARWAFQDYMLDAVAKKDGPRAVRLVEDGVRCSVRRSIRKLQSQGSLETIREHTIEKEVRVAVRQNARMAFDRFTRLMRACERLRDITDIRPESPDDPDRSYFRIWRALDSAVDVLAALTAEAVVGFAEYTPAALHDLLSGNDADCSDAMREALAKGLARSGPAAADDAVAWLLASENRLSLRASLGDDETDLAVAIIRQHAGHCSPLILQRLETAILSYHPEFEKAEYRYNMEYFRYGRWGYWEGGRYIPHVNPMGRTQHRLLWSIPESRRSDAVKERLKVWQGKFGTNPLDRPGFEVRGGVVHSPVPADRAHLLSDREWLKIAASTWHQRRLKQVAEGQVAESSHVLFANDFGKVAKGAPARFVALGLRLPEKTPAIYLTRLWDALADKVVDIGKCGGENLERLIDRSIAIGDRDTLSSMCRCIGNHGTFKWGEAVWRALTVAVDHEDPQSGEYSVHHSTGTSTHPNLESTGLNCIRGIAASTLGGLVWDQPARMGKVLPLLERLADDPHPAVRVEAAHGAFAVYTNDKELGFALLLRIAAHSDDRVLGGRWFNELVKFARWFNPGGLESIFARMCRSSTPAVTEKGANWVTAEYFQTGRCRALFRRCRSGTVPQRLGVVRMLPSLLLEDGPPPSDPATSSRRLVAWWERLCDGVHVWSSRLMARRPTATQYRKRRMTRAIASYFNDADGTVRTASVEAFRFNQFLVSTFAPHLAMAFTRSASFKEQATTLTWALDHQPANLVPFTDSIFAVADRLSGELAPETQSLQSGLGMAGGELSSLLLKLYKGALEAGDNRLAEECLDRWDSLLRSGVGDAERHLEQFGS